jgi:RNA polymerase sigma-70 factor, ECF subfamily
MITQFRLLKRLLNPVQEVDWEALYAEHLPRVYNFFRYRLADDALAEDLTQLTFEKAWKARHSYRKDLAAFSTWIFQIARNTAADHYRCHRVEAPLDETWAEPGDSLEEKLQHQGDVHHLVKLLQRLPDREQELVALKYGAGLTNRTIAEQTGLSESNVGTLLNRLVKRLREEWEAKT